MASIASKLRARNRCNHRDFQNLGVNGARASSPNIFKQIESAARDHQTDHPALVIYSLIGNDICNGHPGTSAMTPPADFRAHVLQHLAALDDKLPAGSFVLLVGTIDGAAIFDTLHAQQHPLGTSYSSFYDFLNCNDASPCRGWMTSNASDRAAASAWSASLRAEYKDIIANPPPYANIELGYVYIDLYQLLANYKATGGAPADMFEAADGFHPSQVTNEMIATMLWDFLETEFPQVGCSRRW